MSLITAFVLTAALFAAIALFNGIVSMAHGGAFAHFNRIGARWGPLHPQ